MLFEFLYNFAGSADFYTDTVGPIFRSVDQGPMAKFVKEAWYFTPMAGCFHLVALSLLGGAIVMSDLKVIGPGVTASSPAELNRKMNPILIWSTVVLIISGILLALGEVMRLYASPPYWLKMASLFSAILFTFTTRNSVVRNDGKFSVVAWVGLAVSMIVYWASWIHLTDWFFGARQAFIIFFLLLAGMVVAPKIVPSSVSGIFKGLPVFVAIPLGIIIVGLLIAGAFLLSGIDYMTEADMNGMGIGAYFQPMILLMMVVSFLAGLVAWTASGNEEQPMSMRIVSAISIFLWVSTAIAGRWIAFW